MTYFELEKYSCVDVKRDTEWFHTVFPKIRNFWREVLDARIHPEKYMKKEKEVVPSNKVVVKKTKKEPCKIEFDPEEDTKTVSLSDEQIDNLYKNVYLEVDAEKKEKEKEKEVCLIGDTSSDE
jgi:hypothetical protein